MEEDIYVGASLLSGIIHDSWYESTGKVLVTSPGQRRARQEGMLPA